MKTLHLTLKKKWFDMILSGEKKEEYRQVKPYWINRLSGKKFDTVTFKNGYNANSPTIVIECKDIWHGEGIYKWGAEKNKGYFIISLGKIISTKNLKQFVFHVKQCIL